MCGVLLGSSGINSTLDTLETNYQLQHNCEMDSHTSESIELPECKKHSLLKQEYYCVDCSELLCKRCMMEKHRLHNYDETEMVMLSLYSSLPMSIQSSKETIKLAEQAASSLDSSKADIRMDEGQLKVRIETFFDQCRKQLDQCQSSLLESVTKAAESKVSSLDTKSQQIASAHASLLKAIEGLQKLANNKVTVTILTEGREYIEVGKTQQDVLSVIAQSVSEGVRLSIEFKEVSSEEVTKTLTHLYVLSGESGIADSETTGSPLKMKLDSKATNSFKFDPKDSTDETSVNQPLPRISSLPALHTVPDSSKPVRHPPLTATLKAPISVIPLTQKDRFAGENIHPCGIAVGTNNQIIVTDVHSNSVKVLAKTGKVIDTIGSNRCSTPFRGPCAVALDEDNNIFIIERETRRIHKFSSGNLVELAKVSRRLVEPWGIAIANGKIFVTDWQGCCIHVFEHAGGNKCNHISSIGSDFLKQPAGIAISPRGHLVVADQENHCVWILTQEGRSLIHPIGNTGGQLYQPFGVTVTPQGLLIVSDKGNSCISVFTEQGHLVECFGRKGSQPGEFDQPRHLCVNSVGQILVADELNQRIQIFELTPSDS